MDIKIILVCKTKGKQCDEKGFQASVGSEEHLFCCENGFKESLEDFKKAMQIEGKNNENFNLN